MPASPKTILANLALPIETGVYCWRNNINGKVYVGQAAITFRHRRLAHLRSLRKNVSKSIILQHAWNKYGENAFEWSVLWKCIPEDCNKWEQWWIDYLKAVDREHGYNMCPVAGSKLGVKMTAAHKAKIGLANKKAHSDPELRKLSSERMKRTQANPVNRANTIKRLEELRTDSSYVLRHSEATKKAMRSPEVRARQLAGIERRKMNRKKQVNNAHMDK